MSFEDLQVLKEAREVIARLAATIGIDIDELPDTYGDAYQKLDEVIAKWETTP